MRFIPPDLPLPALGTEEDEALDFKLEGYDGNDQARREAAADIAQFANRRGGRLVLGAADIGERVTAYPGLADIAVQDQRVEDVGNSLLDPRPDVTTRRVHAVGGGEVLVVTVQPYVGVVGVRYQGGEPRYRFPIRIGKSKRSMNFAEVERMWTQDRRARLLLESIPQANRHQIRIDGDLMRLKDVEWALDRLEDFLAVFKEPGGTQVFIPYAFVAAVWPSSPHGEHTVSITCALTNVPDQNRVLVERERRLTK